jgi:hypothetical protein
VDAKQRDRSTSSACRATAPRPTRRMERTCHGLRRPLLAQEHFTNRSHVLPRTKSKASLEPRLVARRRRQRRKREALAGWGNIGRDSARMVVLRWPGAAGLPGKKARHLVRLTCRSRFCPLRLADSSCWICQCWLRLGLAYGMDRSGISMPRHGR